MTFYKVKNINFSKKSKKAVTKGADQEKEQMLHASKIFLALEYFWTGSKNVSAIRRR